MSRLATVSIIASLFAPLSAQIFVSPTGNDTTGNGTVGNPYLTITRATTGAPAGSTIQLAAGTYGTGEQIVLTTTAFTLVGAGVGQTIIKPHATLGAPYPVGTPPGTLEAYKIAIAVDGPARVDIRNLTIDCDFNFTGIGTGRLVGLYLRNGADVVADNVEITNVRTNPVNGIQGPVAVVVRGDNNADRCELTMRGCYVHDWGKNGFVASFNSHVVLEGNEFVGSGPLFEPFPGPSVPAQNCVQIGFGATGVVRGNLIKDAVYPPATVTSTGILLFNAGPGCIIEGNQINRCQTPCYAIQSPAANVPLVIRRNRMTESNWGLTVDDNFGVTVTGNVVHGGIVENAYDGGTGANTNVWTNNNFSDWSGVGAYAIPGGDAVDPTPRRGFDDLSASTSVAVGGVPNDLVTADLGGTSALDFATVNDPASFSSAPSLSVGINTGFPSYAVQTLSFGVAGEQPSGLCVGEFNGSAGLDLAVVTSNLNNWYVFANNGTGTFSLLASGTLPPAALVPNDVACGDLNGDGRADLAVSTLGLLTPGGGFVLLNNGTGTGFASSTLPGTFTGGCKSIAIGNLDAAAGLDIALTEGSGAFGRVHVYSGNGAGVFTAMASSPVTVDTDPTNIALADVDADGDNDLGVSCTRAALPLTPGSVVFLLNNLPTGFASTTHVVGRGPQSVAFGDLSADADPDTQRRDAAVVNFAEGTVSVLSSYSRGGFGGNLYALTGTNPRASALALMDGDGLGDLVVADAATSSVIVVSGVFTARADLFGQGCPGTFGRIPLIAASGGPAVPTQPNLSFGVQVTNARSLSVGVLIASGAPAPVLSPCSFLLASADVVWTAFTNAAGQANVAIPVPPAPPLNGVTVHFQWAIVDPFGQFVGTFALSEGLKIRVGS